MWTSKWATELKILIPPFTRYNRRLSNRLYNRFDNRFDNRLYRVNGLKSDRHNKAQWSDKLLEKISSSKWCVIAEWSIDLRLSEITNKYNKYCRFDCCALADHQLQHRSEIHEVGGFRTYQFFFSIGANPSTTSWGSTEMATPEGTTAKLEWPMKGGVLGDGMFPSPPARGLTERCELLHWGSGRSLCDMVI